MPIGCAPAWQTTTRQRLLIRLSSRPIQLFMRSGEPFKGGLYYLAPCEICTFAHEVSKQIYQLRLKYAGRDYSSARKELSVDIRAMKLDVKSTVAFLKRSSLANVAASG